MGVEWKCRCKDCPAEFSYSDTKYQAGVTCGLSRPERCDRCRAQHTRETQSVGQAYYKVKALKPVGDPRRLTSDLGRFDREDRPHEREETRPAPIDPDKFGIKDDRIVELFHFFKQDPGLQVVVVVGPTGSGKSTYFPYRLVEVPPNYTDTTDPARPVRDTYWTVPIRTDADLTAARADVKHTPLEKGHHRHHTRKPADPRAVAHPVGGKGGLDPKMFWRYGQIVVTQPRIQATRNIPEFIATAMMGCKLGAGHDVGFRHSGSPNSDWSTKLAFVTDGTLITWLAKGELDKINTVMIDEAHERSLNIDIIIGMLTQLLPRHPRLRLIIASATIAADKFITHFNKHLPRRTDADGNVLPNCRLMEFEGKSFKVSSHFRRADEPPLDYHRHPLPPAADGTPRWEGRHRQPAELSKQVAEKAVELLKEMYSVGPGGGYLTDHAGQQIDITERQGDILGFLHGEKPIEDCCATVERLCGEAFGERVTVKALPLYTTLDQGKQDDALKERPQPHGKLFDKLVAHLEGVVAGRTASGDVLAILNNAGQIHNLCRDLDRRLAAPTITIKQTVEEDGKKKTKEVEVTNPLAPLKGKVVFAPWFTPQTAKQLYETMPERWELTVPARKAGVMRVVISTTRHRAALKDTFPTVIELPPEERRVVVSTNVAETSLTIHGILHVVDSGLINQNKWDAATQTSGVSPILQSRAGCKQRWGRAGRLQAGDAWLLYTDAQFGKEQGEDDANAGRVFDFYSKPEIARSPLEQVLLTAKKAGVQDLDPARFPWLDPPDQSEYDRSVRSLTQKGALDPDGDLTAHGVELGSMIGVDARVGNLLVVGDRFACAFEVATAVAVATAERKGLKALLEFDKAWDEQTTQEVRRRQAVPLAGCKDDLDAALKLVACWEEVREAGKGFERFVRLVADGDELTAEYRRGGTAARELIERIQKTTDEAETDRLVRELVRTMSDRQRASQLRTAAEQSLATRKAHQRLGGAWRAVANLWSYAGVWDEAVAAPLLAKLVLPDNAPATEREGATATFADMLPQVREAVARRSADPREFVRRLPGPRRPSPELLAFLAGMGDPAFATDAHAVAAALNRLAGGDGKEARDALGRLPAAAAWAWARSCYLRPEALTAVVDARNELLQPLEAHKKGSDWRPLDLARTDRVRALFAHCLPDNAYRRGADGAYRPAAAGVPAAVLDVEPAADSVCAADPPEVFVCVERRAGPAVEGKPQKLFASFLVKLPTAWATALADPARPLHTLSAVRLGRFVADNCKADERFGRDLLADAIFPRAARCRATVNAQRPDNLWDVTADPPHEWPVEVVPRAKRASDADRVEGEPEEAIRPVAAEPPSFGLTNRLRNLPAGVAVEDSEQGQIDAGQWEKLFETAAPDTTADAQPGGAVVAVGERVPRPTAPAERGPALLAADATLKPGQVVVGEVNRVVPDGVRRVPHLRHLPAGAPPAPAGVFRPADLGREFELTVVRAERLPLDAGGVLVARERKSGCEVLFGPRDLSFGGCGAVPELIGRHLRSGKVFAARLVQVDAESGRVRMTTHHRFDERFPAPDAVTGRQRVEVLPPSAGGRFVRVVTDDPPEASGFVVVARLGGESGPPAGDRPTVHLYPPNRTREDWPEESRVPPALEEYHDPEASELVCHGRLPAEVLTRALAELDRDDRAGRAAVNSLYERTRQLTAMDEAEYARWTGCLAKPFAARVTRCSTAGVELRAADRPGVPLWLPKAEYSWFHDEPFDAVRPGAELTVIGTDVELERNQVRVSRRRTTPNPYEVARSGRTVWCTVLTRKPNGVEVGVKRLRGWAHADQLVWLPQEPRGEGFEAVMTVRFDDKWKEWKLTVSRRPLVGPLVRRMAERVILRGTVTQVKPAGADVELAPGVVAFLPAGEATWEKGEGKGRRALEGLRGKEVQVVLLPALPDKPDGLAVSRKRAFAGEYRLGGEAGLFFGKGWANVKEVAAQVAAQGPAGADGSKTDSGRLVVGGDTQRAYQAMAAGLTALAARTRCSLTPLDRPRGGPVWLAELKLPDDVVQLAAAPPVPLTTAQPVPPPVPPPVPLTPAPPAAKGWFGRLSDSVRKLFGD